MVREEGGEEKKNWDKSQYGKNEKIDRRMTLKIKLV